MAPLVVAAHLTTAGKDARQKVVEGLTKIMTYAKEKEPSVTKYCIAVPQDALDETSIFVIEEYTDKAALDAHMASPGVASLLELFSSNPALLAEAPTIHNLTLAAGFTRPTVSSHREPYIVFATLDYKPGTVEQALRGWHTVAAETEKSEPGSLSYNILTDGDKGDSVKTVEVYESREYLFDTHAKSAAVVGNKEKDQERRAGLKHVFLKVVAGYLWKEQTP